VNIINTTRARIYRDNNRIYQQNAHRISTNPLDANHNILSAEETWIIFQMVPVDN